MHRLALYLARAAAIVLIAAGTAKAVSPGPLTVWIENLVQATPRAARAGAGLVIAAELAVGLLSLLRPRLGAPFAAILFAGFVAVHLVVLAMPGAKACPCFGAANAPSWATHAVGLPLSLIAVAANMLLLRHRPDSAPVPTGSTSASPPSRA